MRGFILILVMIVAGCTKAPLPAESKICQNIFKAVTGVSQVLGSTLQCEDLSAISGDISKEVMKLNICEAPRAQTILSDLVCPQLSVVVSNYSTSSIPTAWGCSTEVVTELIKSKINAKCVKIIK